MVPVGQFQHLLVREREEVLTFEDIFLYIAGSSPARTR